MNSVDRFIEQIEHVLQASGVSLHPNVETVLELLPAYSDGEILCGYYFVDHTSRSLFWPVDFEADFLLREVKGVTSLTHISKYMQCIVAHLVEPQLQRLSEHLIEAEYW